MIVIYSLAFTFCFCYLLFILIKVILKKEGKNKLKIPGIMAIILFSLFIFEGISDMEDKEENEKKIEIEKKIETEKKIEEKNNTKIIEDKMKSEGAINTIFFKNNYYSTFNNIEYNDGHKNRSLLIIVTNEINENNIIDYSKQVLKNEMVNIHFFKNPQNIPKIPKITKKNYISVFDLEQLNATSRFAHFYRTNEGYESYLKWDGDGSEYNNSDYLDVTDETTVRLFKENKIKKIEKEKLKQNIVIAKKFISDGYIIPKKAHQYYILTDVWAESNAITKERILIIMASLEKEKNDYMMVELFDYKSSKLVGEHGPFKGTKIY